MRANTLVPYVVSVGLALSLWPRAHATETQPPTQEPARPTFTAGTDLVVLRVSVTDDDRGPVTDLGQDDFIIYEDDYPQPVSFFSSEDMPVTVGLVIDNSGSMGPKRSHVYAAAVSFAVRSHPDDEVFVINFNEHVRHGLPADAPFTSDWGVLRHALAQIRAVGKTAFNDAVSHALHFVERGRHDQKVLLVLSDGGDNASALSFDELERQTAESATMVYTVGLFPSYAPDANPGVLKTLAALSGGDAYFPEAPEDIQPVLERIAREIRTTYTLGYAPTNATRDGTFRTLRVSVRDHGRDYRVRHREGYLATPSTTTSHE